MIIIDIGDFDRREVYRGEDAFRAGLAAARAERDKPWRKGQAGWEPIVGAHNPDRVDVDTNGLTEDEDTFIDGCICIGGEFKRRGRRAS